MKGGHIELYSLAKDLLAIKNKQEAELWTDRFIVWIKKYQECRTV